MWGAYEILELISNAAACIGGLMVTVPGWNILKNIHTVEADVNQLGKIEKKAPISIVIEDARAAANSFTPYDRHIIFGGMMLILGSFLVDLFLQFNLIQPKCS